MYSFLTNINHIEMCDDENVCNMRKASEIKEEREMALIKTICEDEPISKQIFKKQKNY